MEESTTPEYDLAGDLATTANYSNSTTKPPILRHDITLRIFFLALEVGVGTFGILLVAIWLLLNRRRKSRLNALIFHVTMADFVVIDCAVVSQLLWETVSDRREWLADDFTCRLVKFIQIFSMMASAHMTVVLAVDRHQAIISPLRKPMQVWKLALIGWSTAVLCSLPAFYIFHTIHARNGLDYCVSIWQTRPLIERQLFIVFSAFAVFYVPVVILLVCYLRIFIKIARKAQDGKPCLDSTCNGKTSSKTEKIVIQSTTSTSFKKAKTKTLVMTIVIVFAYIFCSIPYNVLEMMLTFASLKNVNPIWFAIAGAMAPANSCMNPFVFLAFNVKWRECRGKQRRPLTSVKHTQNTCMSSRTTHHDTETGYCPVRQHNTSAV